MSFRPITSQTTGEALLGIADPTKFVDVYRNDVGRSIYEKRIHGNGDKTQNIKYTIIIIIVSAIIFVTIVSIYDIFRNLINNYYAQITLEEPNSGNSETEIKSTLIANKYSLISSLFFAIFCIITSIILIYLLIKFI